MGQESITRKKLYKSGKSWVAAATAFAVMGGVSITTASADTTNLGQSDTVTQKSGVADQSKIAIASIKKEPVFTATTPDKAVATTPDKAVATTPDKAVAATPDKAVAATPDKAAVVTPDKAVAAKLKTVEATSNAVDQTPQEVTGGQYQFRDGSVVYIDKNGKLVTGLQNISGNLQYFDNDGSQVKGDFRTAPGKNKQYFDKNTGTAIAYLEKSNEVTNGYDAYGNQVKSNFLIDGSNNTYYFDKQGVMLTGLQTIENKQYYFDEQGIMRKSYTGTFNGQVIYFDSTTGVGKTAAEYQFEQGLTIQNDQFTPHNAAKSYDTKSFDNIEGYLTADTWYQPKDILTNGTTWTASTEKDKRPLLMTWWPDQQTQADYLNYMSKIGIITDSTQYTVKSNQSTMNLAVQNVQVAIEKRITQQANTQWLKDAMTSFIKEEYNWSDKSENIDYGGLQFQGGFLKYNNSPLTKDTNSSFRLLNRVLFNRDDKSDNKGSEFLLANDVDNSNPIVQAEQLNWLYYLMNFGTITANDSDANFDGIRIDAVDNVDADLLNIASDYFKAAYKVDQNDNTANKHISILEDWSGLDVSKIDAMGNPQLTMNTNVQNSLLNALTKSPTNRWDISSLINTSLIKSSNQEKAVPNYSFVRAHDSEVQGILGQILTDTTTAKSGNSFTPEELKQAFRVYYKDQKSPQKKYTHYNMVSAYADLLTNKDTVPRVYYGDLYTDGGQYMANKTDNFSAITALLKARIKYVSGNQSTSVDSNHKDVFTSVRDGNNQRNEGIGVIISNNPTLNIGTDTISLSMGKVHANQEYRALMLATDTGIDVYDTNNETSALDPSKAPILTTDSNGNLNITSQYIKGYGANNPLVSGYLGVWIPVGASDLQDVRNKALADSSLNSKQSDNGVFHANAALDTNVIYEGFSNFQDNPTTEAERTNVVISKSAGLFKSWGVTSFQMAPQYRSSQDGTFLDSVIDNGYAFTDRYDVGFNTPTKYGTDADLRSALKALHAEGIQAMADWVPDQIYNLPGQQVASVTRVDQQGVAWNNGQIENMLYVVNTAGGGQYQAEYGGKYLDILQQKYPELFQKNQISTGVPMDANTKIKEWSAKYFNGTNVLGRGAFYVLKDWASNQYFNVAKTDDAFLPMQLMNKTSQTGFTSDAKGVKYFSTSGYQAKNSFVKDSDNNWYYFDKDGYMVRPVQGASGLTKINAPKSDGNYDVKGGKYYYFMPNGIELRNSFVKDLNGSSYYFNSMGERLSDQYVFDTAGNAYHLDSDGTMSIGLLSVGNQTQYFAKNGVQLKGSYAYDKQSNQWYKFDANSGNSEKISRPDNVDQLNYVLIDATATIGINTDYTAYITSSVRNDGLFLNAPYQVKDAQLSDMSRKYNGYQVQVRQQYTDAQGVNWNMIVLNGQDLWVDSRALTMAPFKTMNQTSFISYANRNDGLFLNAPYQVKGYQLAGMSNQYKGQQVTIAGVANVSGKDWSLINFNGIQYWIDSQALNTNFTHDMNQKVFVNTNSNLDGLFLNAPYRQSGYKLAGLAKNYNNQTVTISQQYFDDQGTVWSQVVLGGQTVWVDNQALAQMQVSDTDQQLYVNSNGRSDGLFLNAPYRGQGSQLMDMTANYNGQHVQVTKQGQDAYGSQWRLITLNNQQVWVDSRALTTTIMQAMNDDMYVNSNQRIDGLWSNAPYTMSGAKWAGDTRSANGQYVHVSKAYSNEVGNTYYLTNLNDKKIWIDKQAFTDTFDQSVALNATIQARKQADGMFTTAPYGESGANFVNYVTPYVGQKVQVTKAHGDVQGKTWYLATVNGQQVWIDERSFSPVVTKTVTYSATITPRTKQDALFSGAPYGSENAKLIGYASNYRGKSVSALEEYTDKKGITWDLVKLDNQQVWVDKRALQV
ncbi:glycoside hydrolase family 70 protein [Leuconostoc gasicomitatum]|uniref:glycoside hydrolase family 70 protein n=1 Tax=Leuconostoc gasicomitatum TaxID=115778 RepID=UPI001CC69FF9|nr:glycoside hydrolase family 70 protein [Leuconostoc gasicomitatum]